ncbi:DUF5590 domain-containing protein [Thalassobacillus hwangdonensis]|uniref:DUF5590 domain-containing protein n=2 Tax=Thalassobacillus hwangdonensis TaxID=546108 RepID=A0ABW3KX49_9BACI
MTKKRQSSRYTAPKWLKWTLLALTVVLLLVLGTGYWFYSGIFDKKSEGFSDSEQIALSETPLTEVNRTERYNGDQVVHIVKGKAEDGSGTAFIEKESKELIEYIAESEMISEAALNQQWQSSCDKCEWRSMQLAMENAIPYWEITYIDAQGRYVFAYFDIQSGERKQQFAFKQS